MKKISKDSKFLKGFSKIKVGSICKSYNLDPANVQSGRTTSENEKKVLKRLLKEILLLFIMTYLDDEIEVIEDARDTL